MKFITADVNWSDALGLWQQTCEWNVGRNPWSKTTAKYTRGWKRHEGGWLRQRATVGHGCIPITISFS